VSIEATNPRPFQPVFFKLSAFTVGQKSALVSQVLVLGETKSISMRPVSVDLEDSWKSEGEEGGMGWLIKSHSDDFDNHGFLNSSVGFEIFVSICTSISTPFRANGTCLQPT